MGIGWQELLIFLAILFLLFGAARIPKIARSLGESLVEFKKGIGQGQKESETPSDSGKPSEPSKS